MHELVIPAKLICSVVGVTFVDAYPDNLYLLERVAADTFIRGDERLAVVLVRNPGNEHDPNAVEVHVPAVEAMIGHLPRGVAKRLAPGLDAGERCLAEITAVAIHPVHPDRPGIHLEIRRVDREPADA